MAKEYSSRGYIILLALVIALIVFQALAIGQDNDALEHPMLSFTTSFNANESFSIDDGSSPMELKPENFEPGALSTLPGEEKEKDSSDISAKKSLERKENDHSKDENSNTDKAQVSSKKDSIDRDRIEAEKLDKKNTELSRERKRVDEKHSRQQGYWKYKVKTGDNLWKLSRQYGISVDALKSWNNLTSKNKIIPGQILKIPEDPKKTFERRKTASSSKNEEKQKTLTYTVREGDNLYLIAKKFKTSVASLLLNNNLVDPERLRPGQILRVTTANRIVHIVNKGENLWELSKLYSVPLNKLITHNNIKYRTIFPGQRLSIPVESAKALEELINKGHSFSAQYEAPLKGRLCGVFGWRIHPILKKRLFHCGVDLASPSGTKIGSVAKGKVTFAGWLRGYGKVVVVKHGPSISSRYAHCKKIEVNVGDHVDAGDEVAKVGTTGLSTGPHLHLEIRKNGHPVDPRKYVAL